MTLATYNHYVDSATGVSKTGLSYGRLGARHAGAKESKLISLLKLGRTKRGKHGRVAGRHAMPPRAFF
jgi:hypothetical protein